MSRLISLAFVLIAVFVLMFPVLIGPTPVFAQSGTVIGVFEGDRFEGDIYASAPITVYLYSDGRVEGSWSGGNDDIWLEGSFSGTYEIWNEEPPLLQINASGSEEWTKDYGGPHMGPIFVGGQVKDDSLRLSIRFGEGSSMGGGINTPYAPTHFFMLSGSLDSSFAAAAGPVDGNASRAPGPTADPARQAAAAAGVAAAVGLASLLMHAAQAPLAGAGASPKAAPGPPVNEQGQVFYQPPWDEGGAYWMNGDEYRRMQDMQAQGKVWSNEYGWQDPSDLANYRGQVQNQRDYMAEEVRDHVAEIRTIRKVEEDTTLNDYDLLRLDNYITRRAPNDEAAELMHEVINKMTIKTDDGKVIGSSEDIAREISHILQQTNQPDLTRLERYSIREEIIDEGRLAGGFRDFTSDYININSDSIDILNKLDEAKELVEDYGIDLSDVADRFKYYGYLDKANKLMGTYEGLLAAGYSSKEASIRAFVESGVQLGYGFIIDKNPLLKGADVLAGYSTKVLLGREANVSEALQFVTRTALDLSYEDEIKVFYNVATNKFEMGAGSHIDLSDPKFLKSANQGLADALRKQIELPNLDFETRKYLEEELRNLSGTL